MEKSMEDDYVFMGVTKARQNLSALLIFKFSDTHRIPRKNIRFHSKPLSPYCVKIGL